MRLSNNRVLATAALAYVAVFREHACLISLFGSIIAYHCSLDLILRRQLAAFVTFVARWRLHRRDRAGWHSKHRPKDKSRPRTIGLSKTQTMYKVVLPQALRRMTPPLVTKGISLLKYSSLVSVLGVAVTYQAQVLSTTISSSRNYYVPRYRVFRALFGRVVRSPHHSSFASQKGVDR